MRTGGLGFPFRACHRAVVKQKQGPCPSRMLAPEGPTLPIPSPDPSQLTDHGVSVFCSSFFGQEEAGGAMGRSRNSVSLSDKWAQPLEPSAVVEIMKDTKPGHDR